MGMYLLIVYEHYVHGFKKISKVKIQKGF